MNVMMRSEVNLVLLVVYVTICILNRVMDLLQKEPNHSRVSQSCSIILFIDHNVVGRRKRCGSCNGCVAKDCKKCNYCFDKPKYGGRGVLKQCCINKRCEKLGFDCDGSSTA